MRWGGVGWGVEVFIFCSDWADSFLDLFLKIESFTFRLIALFKKLLKSYDYEKEDRALVKKQNLILVFMGLNQLIFVR
jgi:hypothetical protein